MPTPGKDESEDDFVQRCIPIVMDEGTAEDGKQAAAICHNMWRDHNKSSPGMRRVCAEPIRAVAGDDGRVRYRAMAVRFGSPDELDWYGTYFDRDTQFHLDWFRTRPWIYNHGYSPMMGNMRVGEWTDWEITDEGVFFVGELLEHFKYRDAVQELLTRGVLYPSTGTLDYMADLDWMTGHMREWPIVELSSTTAPAEFRMEPLAPEVAKAISTLRGGIVEMLGQRRPDESLIDKAKRLFRGEAAEEEQPAVEEPEEETTPPTEPAAEEEPVPSSEDLGGVQEELGELRRAIVMLDNRLAELGRQVADQRAAIVTLAQTHEQSVKQAMTDGKGWLDRLYVASRDAEPEPVGSGDAGGVRTLTTAEIEAQGGILGVIRRQQNASQ